MPITPLPDAHFVPPMKGYSGQGAFRFWCQTVLPIVYDDSLSYYELLNKVVVYLNNTISDVANMEDNVQALANAYEQLENYVNTYFDSLDVQQEINNKLDEMAIDGTLTQIVAPVIGESVTAWLNEHIVPTSPPVDNTFTIEGAAANSKTVGDKTHWYRGTITNELLSSKVENGWWTLSNRYTTSEDLPVPLTNLAYLHVFKANTHAYQLFRQWTNDCYIRDITLSSGSAGPWVNVGYDRTFSLEKVGAEAKTVGDKTHWYRGTITTELLSSKIENGWWALSNRYTTSEDLPVPLTNLAYLHVFKGDTHTYQFFRMWSNVCYLRDINNTTGEVGPWVDPTTNYFYYRGHPTTEYLSDCKQNGWYTVNLNATISDSPVPITDYTILKVYNTGYGCAQTFTDVLGRFEYNRWIRPNGDIGDWFAKNEPYQNVSYNIERFTTLMNKRAAQLNLNNTQYASANGLNRSNVGSPSDMCRLVAYASNISVLNTICNLESTKIFVNDTEVEIASNNLYQPIRNDYHILYCKTGYLTASGANPQISNLVCAGVHKTTGICVVGCVLLCDNETTKFTAMKQLLDRCVQIAKGETPTISVQNTNNYAGGTFMRGDINVNILASNNPDTSVTLASVTKTMTCIIATESFGNLHEKVRVRPSAIATGSGNNLASQDIVSIHDLIADGLIVSSNTAMNVIADQIGNKLLIGA